jgi:hypothetical protein
VGASGPRVVMTLLVRDEEQIVAANIRHHLNHGVDFVVATDNASVDGTRDLLVDFEQQGVLHLIDEPDLDFAQHRWVTRMARLAATDHAADWVINADADEFWIGLDGDLADVLRRVSANERVVEAQRFNFVPPPRFEPPFWEAMTIRFAGPILNVGGPLPPKVAHRAHSAVVVRQGGHEVELDGSGDHEVPRDEPARIELLHFPNRSFEEFERAVVNTGTSYRNNSDLPAEVGHRRRQLYEQHEAGQLDQVWAPWVLDDQGVQAGLADGSLVHDSRLRDHLRALSREP